jgi:hypothetical protein
MSASIVSDTIASLLIEEFDMAEPRLILVDGETDPAQMETIREQHARAVRNSEWLAGHWCELLPGARGRFVAVAGQQAFIADTAEEAWRQAKAAHPEDNGAILQFVRKDTNPRIYANLGNVVDV